MSDEIVNTNIIKTCYHGCNMLTVNNNVGYV